MAPRAEMPLFPDEVDIARAVLGPGRVNDWKCLAPSLERQGLPQVDPVFGGRYWPAVKAWMDRRAGLTTMTVPARPGGKETWK
ncbi:hypothetical protein [Xanthobacter flavus]|uniref:hypothetical protein n=1 Tax=Xanthobacter flavus TaxID=281 RepID=UPI00372BD8D0